jgi:EAL domain-containing protein (putative c-di-GMP-specific phosphodiesterase class I)/anti-sigma regulatory factor (Ser/Thr protein kinase)
VSSFDGFERRKRVRRLADVRPPARPLESPLRRRLARYTAAVSRGGRRRLAGAIARGLEAGEFELRYQPQLELDTGRPYGVEALVRWRRGDRLLEPARFLAAAETSGTIAALTDRVLDLAVAQAGEWRRGGRELRVAVNISPASLRDFSVPRRLERLLADHDVPGQAITIEVTETAVLDEPEKARAVLDAIAELGVWISVDDFGTGYSSLLWLRLFPVSEVKVDQTFVSALHEDGEAYVSGVIRLGHDLDLSVVAEGVEDTATLEVLQELDCDAAQGYLFAHPLDAAAVGAWIDEQRSAPWAPSRREIAVSPGEPGLDRARRLIDEAAQELGYDEAAIWDMKTAATEALMNAVEHGPPSDDGLVRMRIVRRRGELRLEVWGGGEGDGPPSPAGTQRGRGIAIMTALMDEVEIKRDAEDATISLAKRRTPNTPSQD